MWLKVSLENQAEGKEDLLDRGTKEMDKTKTRKKMTGRVQTALSLAALGGQIGSVREIRNRAKRNLRRTAWRISSGMGLTRRRI